MLTVNDLIGLNYANLRNPQPADMGPGLSYQIDPAAQGGRRLVSDIKPAIDRGANRNFSPSNFSSGITSSLTVGSDSMMPMMDPTLAARSSPSPEPE